MNELDLDVNFLINSPEIKAAATQVKAEITGIGVTAEQVQERVRQNARKIIPTDIASSVAPQIGILEQLSIKLNAAKEAANKATTTTGIEIANAKIQEYQREIERLSVIGKQGFDDLGNKIANEIEKPIGKLQRLQKVAELYANMSATSNNPEIISKYNAKLQQTQIEIERIKNVGKKGFDELGNAIQNNGNLLNKVWGGLKMAANILPGLGIAGLLAFAVEPLLNYISTLDVFKKKVTEGTLEADGLTKAFADGGEYATAVTNVATLTNHINLAKKGIYDKKAVVEEYNKTIGVVAGQIKSWDEVEQASTKNAPSYIKMTLYKAAAIETLKEMGKKAAEAERERIKSDDESLNYLERFGRFMAEKTKDLPMAQATIDYKALAQSKRAKVLKTIEEESKPLQKIADEFMAKAAAEAEKMGGSLGIDKSVKNNTKSDATIKAAEALQRQVYEIREEYNRKSKSKDEEELQAVRDKFKKLADEVVKFNADPKHKVKVDGSSLTATKDKAIDDLTYRQGTEKLKIQLTEEKALWAEYEDYKLKFGDEKAKERYGNQLDISKSFLENVKTEYDKLALKNPVDLTGSEKERLEALKKLLEEAKKEKLKAEDENYKAALEASKTYNDKLIEIDKEYLKNKEILTKNGMATPERLAELDRVKKDAVNAAKDEALQKTAIYQKLAIDTLEMTRTQVIAQVKLLKELLGRDNIPAEIKEQLKKELSGLEIALKFGIDNENLTQLKTRYRDLINELSLTDANGKSIISDKERIRILKAIDEVKAKIKTIDSTGNGKLSYADKLARNFEYLKGSAQDVADGLNRDLSRVSGAFSSMANEVGGVNTQLGQTLTNLSKLLQAGAGAAQSIASIKAGDIVGGVSSAIGAVSLVVGIMKSFGDQVETFYANAAKGEREYQDLLRQRALATVKDNQTQLNGIVAEMRLRKKQLEEFNKESIDIMAKLQTMQYVRDQYTSKILFIPTGTYNVLESLKDKSFAELQQLLLQGKLAGEAKTLVERLVELEKQGFDATQAMKELAQQLNELFTGTTTDALADAFVQLFRDGKTEAQDFVDFFQNAMEDAAFSIFKNKILADALDNYYKEFAATAEGGLTVDEIAKLKLLYGELVAKSKQDFEDLQKATGLDLTNKNAGTSSSASTSIVGQIQRNITEQTGSELVGLYRTTYDLSKRALGVHTEGLQMMKQQAMALIGIEQNTAQTVVELKNAVVELKKIRSNSDISYDRGW